MKIDRNTVTVKNAFTIILLTDTEWTRYRNACRLSTGYQNNMIIKAGHLGLQQTNKHKLNTNIIKNNDT